MPPIFSPGIYLDGLECPAMYYIQGKWYLLYGVGPENGETVFRYALADSPFGSYRVLDDNQLLPENNYNCRIINHGGKNLLYHWFRDSQNGMMRERLASPKKVHILKGNKIFLADEYHSRSESAVVGCR